MDASTTAVNALGLELLGRTGEPDENALISPLSIQCALAMAYAGAEGTTRTEMAKALHYGSADAELHLSFAARQKAFQELENESARAPGSMHHYAPSQPITLRVANCLFGQHGYDFRKEFLSLMKENYRAPFQTLDFGQDPAGATATINLWVEEQTRQKIREILPEGELNKQVGLVLVNAIYLKAAWNEPFASEFTRPLPFHLASGRNVEVPTMVARHSVGYAKKPEMTVLALPYAHRDLQCVIFLPHGDVGLAELGRRLNNDTLAESRCLPTQEVNLHLPKLRIAPPLLRLGAVLRALGIKSAFDEPRGSANFEGIAPRQGNNYLYLSEVFHKTFLNLDESGTEAAAATSLAMWLGCASEPVQVHVDRPFIFAIQHVTSGACLFLGHVADPLVTSGGIMETAQVTKPPNRHAWVGRAIGWLLRRR